MIDGELAFVGGIDLTDSAGDRYDTQAHHARRRQGWHDVATRLRGPAVADVGEHFRVRWRELTGEVLPEIAPPPPAGDSTVQVLRTVEEDMYDSLPRGDFRIFESYLRVLRGARELIYIENQFLWSPELVSVLADKLRNPPTPDFRVVVLLPAKANNGAEDTRGQVGVLIDADDGAERFLAATIRSLSAARDRADPLYVHAKVAVVDDRWLIVGSANLNAHSFFNDTEMCVATDDADAGPRHPRAPVGRASGAVRGRGRRQPAPSTWSTASGARSPTSSSSACARSAARRTGCSSCPACRGAPGACSARCPAWSTTVDHISAYDLAVRSAGTQQSSRSPEPGRAGVDTASAPDRPPARCTAARWRSGALPAPTTCSGAATWS